MVRRESCISLAGASPVRTSSGTLGSRLREWEEIPVSERSVKSLEKREQRSGPQRK